MFGISFGELLVIGVVGLVVLGPERLPAVARTLGRLMRQVQDYTDSFKAELNRELHNAEILQLEKELKAEGRQLHNEIHREFSEVQLSLEQETDDDEPDEGQKERWHSGPGLKTGAQAGPAGKDTQTEGQPSSSTAPQTSTVAAPTPITPTDSKA